MIIKQLNKTESEDISDYTGLFLDYFLVSYRGIINIQLRPMNRISNKISHKLFITLMSYFYLYDYLFLPMLHRLRPVDSALHLTALFYFAVSSDAE